MACIFSFFGAYQTLLRSNELRLTACCGCNLIHGAKRVYIEFRVAIYRVAKEYLALYSITEKSLIIKSDIDVLSLLNMTIDKVLSHMIVILSKRSAVEESLSLRYFNAICCFATRNICYRKYDIYSLCSYSIWYKFQSVPKWTYRAKGISYPQGYIANSVRNLYRFGKNYLKTPIPTSGTILSSFGGNQPPNVVIALQ